MEIFVNDCQINYSVKQADLSFCRFPFTNQTFYATADVQTGIVEMHSSHFEDETSITMCRPPIMRWRYKTNKVAKSVGTQTEEVTHTVSIFKYIPYRNRLSVLKVSTGGHDSGSTVAPVVSFNPPPERHLML